MSRFLLVIFVLFKSYLDLEGQVQKVKKYFEDNKLVMLIVISSLAIGVVLGALMATRVSPEEGEALCLSVNQSIAKTGVYASFLKALSLEFKSFLILFVCGIAIIGSPAAAFYIGTKGYAVGFTVAFFMRYYGLMGLLASLGGVLPHYIVLIPAFMCMGVVGINFSNKLLLGEKNLKDNLKIYIAKSVLIAIFVLFGCAVEGFVSSPILKMILSI